MTWTPEQRIRVLAHMGDDLSVHEWASIMECPVDDIWRCAAIAASGNARAQRNLASATLEGVTDGSEVHPGRRGHHLHTEETT